ncbi:MAG TPA: hypothetical protein VEX88_08425 [Glaciibacter sp.]|nr:hypothetical protein [Glaciibacter sp.]
MPDQGKSEVGDSSDRARISPPARMPGARLVTEESIYGNLLVSGMIVVQRAHEATSWGTFVGVAGTVIVVWAAHLYAGTVARYSEGKGDETTLGNALRRSFRNSLGFLIASSLPAAVLLLGTLQAVSDEFAVALALWLGVLILGVIGYEAALVRGASVPMRIFGGLSTATFGILMIILEAVLHR